MKKGALILLTALLSVSLAGCSAPEEEHFNPRKFARHSLNSFKISDNTFPEVLPEQDRLFSRYARECSWGIPESGIKMAELYKTTLDPQKEHYLYFQQNKLARMFMYCWLTMISRSKAENEKNPAKFKEALAAIKEASPAEPQDILKIIYSFYRLKDPTSAQTWIAKLNFRERGDVPAMFELGKFLFQAEDMQLQGYTMVETAASMGYPEAYFQLTAPEYVSFRESRPGLQASYQKLMNKGRPKDETASDDEGDPNFGTSLLGKE
ncbi:hypothetical protein [Succinimonas sp.]|uniref:hypothetical protein n=1 Tax=Succinimonas sp. TaxID=1936151 RepID=UPI00386C1149